jgi:hypothetical protein
MRRVGATLAAIALLGLLAGVALFAWAGLPGPDEPSPSADYVALALGVLSVALAGIGLMAVIFYRRRGDDDPSDFDEDR